jgi:2-keto-4-pentenoate hydratase
MTGRTIGAADASTAHSEKIVLMALAVKAAYASGPIAPFSESEPSFDADIAHAVRQATIDRWRQAGRRIVGRKIGLTSAAIRLRLEAPQPTDGFLFADTQTANGGIVDVDRLIQPLAEAELGLILARDIEAVDSNASGLRDGIGGATAAIEIVDSRFEAWRIRYADAIADNGSAAGFALGDQVIPLADCAGLNWTMERTGPAEHSATGQIDLDAILSDLHWLAGAAIAAGEPLRKGDIILSGSLGGAIPVRRGDVFSARIAGLGECNLVFQ